MAEAVANNPHIRIKKSIFGTKAVYQPTLCPVVCEVQEYTEAGGNRLLRLLSLPLDRLAAELSSNGRPEPTAVGPVRLEVCRSRDGQFCAVQLFRFVDFSYQPLCAPVFGTDADAKVLEQLVRY